MKSSTSTSFKNRWIKYSFTGWFIGFFIVIALALLFDTIGLGGTNTFIGLGMGLSVGFFQWKAFQKITAMSKKWIWYSAIGLFGSFVVFELLDSLYSDLNIFDSLILKVSVGGLIVGLLQQKLLKSSLSSSKNWTLVCVVSWALASLCATSSDYDFIPESVGGVVGAVITALIILFGGIVLGFVQSRFLSAFN